MKSKAEEILKKNLPNYMMGLSSFEEEITGILLSMKEIAELAWEEGICYLAAEHRSLSIGLKNHIPNKEQFINQLFNKEDNG